MTVKSASPKYKLPASKHTDPRPQTLPHLLRYNKIIDQQDGWCTLRLGPRLFIQCDLVDAPEILARSWHRYKGSSGSQFLIITNLKVGFHKYRKTSLQKFLLNPPSGLIPAFINDNDRFNFKRSNLKMMTCQEQSRSFGKRKVKTTSIYKGVSYRKHRYQWAAMIKTDEKQFLIGYFESEREAALAYNKAAREHFGDDGYQNEVSFKKK